MTVQYNQVRKDCLRYAEVFRGMHPSMIADQGGLNGLINNLSQSLEFRDGENRASVERFIGELKLVVSKTEHLKPDDRWIDKVSGVSEAQARAIVDMHRRGHSFYECATMIGCNLREAVNAFKSLQK